MDEKPGETPNPLHQSAKTQPTTGTGASSVSPAKPVQTTGAQNTVDPTARPMEKAEMPAAEPVKKKKTGLIVGIIAAVLVLAGAATAAAILLTGGSGDPVVKAIEKIANGDAPQYVKVDGSMEVTSSDDNSAITSMTFKIGSEIDTKSSANSVKADLAVELNGGKSISFDLAGISTKDGDLYFQINGIADTLSEYIDMVSDTTDVSSSAMSAYYLSMFGDIIESLEGKWLKVSAEEIKSIMSSMGTDNQASCLIDLAEEAKTGNNGLADAYRKSPFITSTTEGVTVASKGNGPVYKLVIDKESAKGFAENYKQSDFVKKMKTCFEKSGGTFTEGSSDLSELPDIYVELDKDNNFTRVFTEKTVTNDCCPDDAECYTDCSDSTSKVTVDFGLSYPSSLSVEEPTDSEDLMTVITKIYSSLSGGTVDIEDIAWDDDDD